jgi:hypothetical protein
MIFSAADRKAITRRQLNLQVENNAYSQTTVGIAGEQAKLLQVDNANSIFYNFFDVQVKSYENEARGIDGKVSDEYPYSDLDNAAQTSTYPPFYPSAENYIRFIPNISEYVVNTKIRGRFHITSTDGRYEINILNNATIQSGVTSAISLMTNPLVGAGGTFATNSSIPAGAISNHSVDILSIVQPYSVGDIIIVYDPAGSGLYRVTTVFPAVGPLSNIRIESIVPTLTGIPAGSDVITNAPAFSALERQNMSHPLYDEYLNNVGNLIISLVTEWQGNLIVQLANLTSQNDDRVTQLSQNNTAKADVNSRLSYISSWLGLSFSGVSGKFTVTNINNLSAQVSGRAAFLANRIAQIETALGQTSVDCITQSGDTFSTNVPDNSYYNRYFWINVRINKISGSLRRYYAAGKNINQLQSLINNNLAIEAEYDNYFVTKRLMATDGSTIVQLDNYANFANGDIVYIVSETQPELQLGVVELMGTNQVRFDKKIPNVYIKDDIARIFKLL